MEIIGDMTNPQDVEGWSSETVEPAGAGSTSSSATRAALRAGISSHFQPTSLGSTRST